MPAIHHPTDQTGLTLDELEAELDRIEAKRKEIDRQYLTDCERDYANHLRLIFAPAWDEEGKHDAYYDEPDPCPICGGTGWVDDEDGFSTECNVCRPESDEPWIVPAPLTRHDLS